MAGRLLQAGEDPPSHRPCVGGLEGEANGAGEGNALAAAAVFEGSQGEATVQVDYPIPWLKHGA